MLMVIMVILCLGYSAAAVMVNTVLDVSHAWRGHLHVPHAGPDCAAVSGLTRTDALLPQHELPGACEWPLQNLRHVVPLSPFQQVRLATHALAL